MISKEELKAKNLSEEEIDQLVEAQAEDDSAWEQSVQVSQPQTAALSIPGELAVRAAFLARLHKEKDLEAWLARIIRERVELEEVAFSEAKREMLRQPV